MVAEPLVPVAALVPMMQAPAAAPDQSVAVMQMQMQMQQQQQQVLHQQQMEREDKRDRQDRADRLAAQERADRLASLERTHGTDAQSIQSQHGTSSQAQQSQHGTTAAAIVAVAAPAPAVVVVRAPAPAPAQAPDADAPKEKLACPTVFCLGWLGPCFLANEIAADIELPPSDQYMMCFLNFPGCTELCGGFLLRHKFRAHHGIKDEDAGLFPGAASDCCEYGFICARIGLCRMKCEQQDIDHAKWLTKKNAPVVDMER